MSTRQLAVSIVDRREKLTRYFISTICYANNCLHYLLPEQRNSCIMKKRRERRKHCALANVRRSQTFPPQICPAADPLPGGTGQPKFNQLEMVTTFTHRPSLVNIDARNFELSC